MDFVHDQLVNGQAFRVLTVVDNWSRESPILEGFRLTGSNMVEALSRVGKTMCLPACITVDDGNSFGCKVFIYATSCVKLLVHPLQTSALPWPNMSLQ